MNWDTTNIFLYFFINFFDLWVILRYFNSVLKSIKKRRAFLYGLYLLFLLFFTLLIQYELEYSNLVSIALWSCMFLPTYEGGRRNKIGYAALLLGLAGFAQMIMYLIISSNLFAVYSFFVPHFVFFITTELAGRYQTVKDKRIDGKLLILLVTVPIISFIAMPCSVMLTEQMGNVSFGERTGMLLPVAVLILYVNIIVFYLYDTISSVFEVQKQKEEYEQQLKWQLTYYDTLAENQDVIRKIKHDLQNNLQSMEQLLCEGKKEELAEYLRELITDQEEIRNIISTGNSGIDTILNIKMSLAQRYGIEIRRNISIPAKIPIPYGHCVRIFGNLLDNAINALKDEEEVEKTIHLLLSFQANAFVIQVVNQYRDKPIKYNKDNFFHGLGLDIVKSTVEFYHGIFNVEDDGENFTVNIILYLEI